MRFDWDENKRDSNLKKHRVDLLEAALIFDGEIVNWEDKRRDYGEVRTIAIGHVGNTYYVVVYTERDEKIRLISAWKGGRYEQRIYQDSIAGRDQDDEGQG